MSRRLCLILAIATIQCTFVKTDYVITTLKYSQRYSAVKPTVVNGVLAKLGETPYVVSIKNRNEKNWNNICGGAIYAADRILTAGHCFEEDDFYYVRHPEALRVVAGSLKTKLRLGDELKAGHTQWRHIRKAIIHGNYNFPENDIAIAILNEKLIFTDSVRPIGLARKTSELFFDCWTAGYGREGFSENDKASPELLLAHVKTLPSWLCTTYWELDMNTYICSDSRFSDVSLGDSGSPLVCYSYNDHDEINPKICVEGIVCGKNFDKTTLYTRVSAYYDWIARGMACKVRIHKLLLIITAFLINYKIVYL